MKISALPVILLVALGLGRASAAAHPVSFEKELFITAPEIVAESPEAKPGGAWHIRTALGKIAGQGVDVNAYAAAWFATWTENETLAGVHDKFAKRPWVTAMLQEAWAGNNIHLIAIVNRVDLARFPGGDASAAPLTLGEGRFIYEIRDSKGGRLPFTLIFEYGVPFERTSDTKEQLKAWAKRWHALGRPELASDPGNYRKELVALTDAYSATGTLAQIRTNEFLPAPGGQPRVWEMREFHHRERPAALLQAPVAITPAFAFSQDAGGGVEQLRNFIAGKSPDLLAGRHDSLLREFQGASSPVPSPGFKWEVGDPALARPKFIFSFNTCSGCHAGDTGTFFQHIGVNTGNGLSPFLKGSISIAEPLPPESNTEKSHNERQMRIDILNDFSADSMAPAVQSNLTRLLQGRANRVH
jgi:hypothetical protein